MSDETKCSCQHCSGHIGFERQRVGETVACPHCGLETTLYVPAGLAQQANRPPKNWKGIALLACMAVLGCALVVAIRAGIANRKPNEIALTGQVFIVTASAGTIPLGDVAVLLIERTNVLEYLNLKKKMIAEAIESRQIAINGCRVDVQKAEVNLDRLATANAEVPHADQDGGISYNAMFSEFTNAERPNLVLLQKQIVQAHSILVKHAHDLNDQNSSLGGLAQSSRYGSGLGTRYGRGGPPSSVWGDPPGRDNRANFSGNSEFGPFISLAKNLYDDISTVLGSMDDRVVLQDSFQASSNRPRNAHSDDELSILRAAATLDTIINRVRAKEIELRTLKENSELKAAQIRQDAKARLAAAQQRLAQAELNLAQFDPVKSYFIGFSPKTIFSAQTDATGNFSLRYHPGESLSIFATATRLVGDQTEHYFWLVNAPTNIPSAQIVLSNSKLVSVDPDGYLPALPAGALPRSTRSTRSRQKL